MHCPNCGNTVVKQKVRDTRRTDDGQIVRRRRCLACNQEYRTVEHFSEVGLRIRKSDGRILPFNRQAIRDSLLQAAVKKYDPEQIDPLIDAVITEIFPKAIEGVVPSAIVSEAVLGNFHRLDEASKIRFTLVHLGRQDRNDGQPGWGSVDDFHQWLLNEYEKLSYVSILSRLTNVLKRNSELERYDRLKMIKALKIVAKGRGDEGAVTKLVESVVSDVERELRNQPTVTSGQIATEVMRSLLRRDRIAYLRFASTAKHFRDATDYEAEVEFLLQHPELN